MRACTYCKLAWIFGGKHCRRKPGVFITEYSNSRSLDSECKSSESVTLGVSIHIRKTAIKYSRDLYQHTKTYQTTLRVRHLLTVVAFLRLSGLRLNDRTSLLRLQTIFIFIICRWRGVHFTLLYKCNSKGRIDNVQRRVLCIPFKGLAT